MTTIPAAGDIVWVDLDPVRGTEQSGRRPALVISELIYNQNSARSVICPITSNLVPWPTKVILPEGMKTRGAVLVDQIRAVHREDRFFRVIERAPDDLLLHVRAILSTLLGLTFRP